MKTIGICIFFKHIGIYPFVEHMKYVYKEYTIFCHIMAHGSLIVTLTNVVVGHIYDTRLYCFPNRLPYTQFTACASTHSFAHSNVKSWHTITTNCISATNATQPYGIGISLSWDIKHVRNSAYGHNSVCVHVARFPKCL